MQLKKTNRVVDALLLVALGLVVLAGVGVLLHMLGMLESGPYGRTGRLIWEIGAVIVALLPLGARKLRS